MPKFAIVAGKRPIKRRPADPLADDPIARAKTRYVTSRTTLRDLALEFKGQNGCGLTNLGRLAAEEGWVELREEYRDRVVAGAVQKLETEEVNRNAEHLRMTRNTLNTVEGILSGIHAEVSRVLSDQKERRITATHAVGLLRALATAARNVAMAQGFGITLEQRLGESEGSGFQRLAEAAEAKFQDVRAKRDELVKRAEQEAKRLEDEKRAKRRAGKRGTA